MNPLDSTFPLHDPPESDKDECGEWDGQNVRLWKRDQPWAIDDDRDGERWNAPCQHPCKRVMPNSAPISSLCDATERNAKNEHANKTQNIGVEKQYGCRVRLSWPNKHSDRGQKDDNHRGQEDRSNLAIHTV